MRRAVGRKALERLGMSARTGVQFRFDILVHSVEIQASCIRSTRVSPLTTLLRSL